MYKFSLSFMALSLALLFSSCGSSYNPPDNSSSGGATPAVVSGAVVDDFVSGASVSAYQVTASGTQGALIAGPVTTSAAGAYSLSLGSYTGPVLIESTGGTYVDTSSGATVNLTGSGLTLSAFVPDAMGSVTNTAQVTPLTTIAAQMALTLVAQGTSATTAATQANASVASFFGLSNILTSALLNLNTAGCAAGAAQVSIDESLILAGFSELATTHGVTPYVLILAIIQDVTSDGVFDGTANGTPILVNLTNGGTVTLAAIEDGTATTVAPGGLPGLAAAITAFQGSSANTCGATASSGLGSAVSSPPSPPSPPGTSTMIQVPMVVPGLTNPDLLHFQLTQTSSAGGGAVTAGINVTSGGTYYLHVLAPAGNLTGAAIVTDPNPPSGEGCSWGTSLTSLSTNPLSATYNTTTLVMTPIYLNCTAVTFSVGGSVTGLTAGNTLGIKDTVSGNSISVVGPSGSGGSTYTVDSGLAANTSYSVVLTQPAGQTCSFGGVSSGTISNVNITLPLITCTTGSSGIALNGPGGLAFDSGGNLYVANSNGNQVLEYSVQYATSTNAVTGLTQINHITAGINDPSRLTFDQAGNLYVANYGGNTVTTYNANLVQYTSSTTTTTLTNLSHPLGIAIDNSSLNTGNLYVANNSGNDIYVYQGNVATSGLVNTAMYSQDHAGNAFSAPGVLTFAAFPSVSQNILFVGLGPSTGADTVQLYNTPFTSTSTPIYTFTNASCSSGPSGPTGIAVYNTGNIATSILYVANYYNSNVTAYNLSSISSGSACPPLAGTISQGIAQPEGLAVDAHGNIFVANSSANTITVYTPSGSSPSYTQH